ncbi:MAG: hypothetical protein HYR85_19020 [Planctomycetes bacterium]|nr:hypothetical protein [Planctomycetota bacterium]MBI3847318.1 hypothetical protein [Planctomycetota bacterium]
MARAWPALVIASLIAGLAQLVAIAGATGRFALPGWQWSTQLMAATPIIAWVVLSLAGRVAWPHALGLAALAGTFRLVGLALHAFWPEVRGGSEEHVLSVMLMRDLTIGCLFSTLHIVAARRVGGRVVALREALFLVGASRVMFIGQVAWCLVVNRTLRTPEFDAPSITTTFLVGIVWCLAGLLIAIRIAPLRETAPQATTK